MSRLKALQQLVQSQAQRVSPEKLRFAVKQQKENIARVGSGVKAQAQELNEKYLNDILGYDVQARYNDILNQGNKGMLFKEMSALQEAALFGGAALATGGLGGAAIAGGNDCKTGENGKDSEGIFEEAEICKPRAGE